MVASDRLFLDQTLNTQPVRVTLRRSPVLILVGVLFTLFGTIFGYLTWIGWLTDQKLAAEGITVTGKVLSKRSESQIDRREGRRETVYYYYATVGFPTSKGEETVESGLSKEVYEGLAIGDPMEMEFHPSAPHSARPVGSASLLGTYLTGGLSALLFLTGAIITTLDLKRRIIDSSILRSGIYTMGSVTAVEDSNLEVNGVIQQIVNYSFKDRMGRGYNGRSSPVSPSLLQSIHSGSSCKVAYRKEDPNDSILVGF